MSKEDMIQIDDDIRAVIENDPCFPRLRELDKIIFSSEVISAPELSLITEEYGNLGSDLLEEIKNKTGKQVTADVIAGMLTPEVSKDKE